MAEEVHVDATSEEVVLDTDTPDIEPEEGAVAGVANEVPEEGSEGSEIEGGDESAETDEVPDFSYTAFDEAEAGAVFTDSEGKQFKKIENCDVPVPVIPTDDEMYQFLHSHGFDQNLINEEFWSNNGELSQETLAGLKEVFGPGPVNSYMSNVKAAHLAFLAGAKDQSETAARQAEEAAAARTARDNMIYDAAGKLFGTDVPEEAKEAMDSIITYANENLSQDRRRELKGVLDSGSPFMVNTVLRSLKREMEYNKGDVHNLLDIGGAAPASEKEVAADGGSDAGLPEVGRFVTVDELHKYMNDPRGPYWSNVTFREKVDQARLRAIKAGK